jgi:rod shape-determining protein MreC
MNKKQTLFLFIIFIGVLYYFRVDKTLYNYSSLVSNYIKSSYTNISNQIEFNINKYRNQAKQIENLTKENKKVKLENLKLKQSYDILEKIYDTISTIKLKTKDIKLIEVLSYIDFSDHTKVWLDYKKTDDHIDALIYGEYSAGIVKRDKYGNTYGLLNGNKKCNYAVYIGDDKAPGIIHNKNKNSNILVAKYIPSWMSIYIGDEVITSGMDNIFPMNLKVGKVIKVEKHQDIQEVEIKPYINVLEKKFFYLYKDKK